MKKTLQTVITAAMFAASMGSLPSETAKTVSAADYNPYAEEMQDVYGPPPAWNTPIESVQTTATNEIPAPVYGPPLAWTTTSEIDLPVPTTMPATIPLPVYGPPAAWIGDLNEDGRIDVFDMIELKKAYLNGTTGEDWLDLFRADINQDGKIGMADLVMLQNYLLGKIDNFYDQLPEPKPTTAETQKSYVNTTNTVTTTTEPIPECVYGPPIAFD